MRGHGRTLFFAVLGAWLLYIGARGLWLASLSDEELVRRRLDEMSSGFDRTRLGPTLSGIAIDFRGEPDGVERQDLRRGLAAMFLREIDPESKAFRWRVEIPEDLLRIEFEGEGAARVRLGARFFERTGGVESLEWVLEIDGRMEDRDGEGWVFASARADTVEGRRPRL